MDGDERKLMLACVISGTIFSVLGSASFAILWAVNWRPWRIYRYSFLSLPYFVSKLCLLCLGTTAMLFVYPFDPLHTRCKLCLLCLGTSAMLFVYPFDTLCTHAVHDIVCLMAFLCSRSFDWEIHCCATFRCDSPKILLVYLYFALPMLLVNCCCWSMSSFSSWLVKLKLHLQRNLKNIISEDWAMMQV